MKRIRLQVVEFSNDDAEAIPVEQVDKDLGTIRLAYHRVVNVKPVLPEWPDEVVGETVYEAKPDEVATGKASKCYATHQARCVTVPHASSQIESIRLTLTPLLVSQSSGRDPTAPRRLVLVRLPRHQGAPVLRL
jgi:hypothetical protein